MLNSKMFYEKMERNFVCWAQTVEDDIAKNIMPKCLKLLRGQPYRRRCLYNPSICFGL